MMTLEEAIRRCVKISTTNECKECADEHRQLAVWLMELKNYKDKEKEKAKRRNKDNGKG